MARATDKRWKGHLIDWPTIQAMDAEDYELKPLNQQQVAILLMLLTYQKWTTRWTNLDITDDELQKYIGDIEERLMRNEGGMSIDYEALKNAIRDGMYEFGNDIAKQIVSGRTSNIAVGDDGTVSDPTDEAGDESTLPEDDPATTINETLAAKSGAAIQVRLGCNDVWARLGTLYTNGLTNVQAKNLMLELYVWDDDNACQQLVDTYWTARAGAAPYVSSFAATLDGYIYCKGLSDQTIAEWIYELHTVNQQSMAMLITNLADEQFARWWNAGLEVPSTNYLGYSCTKIDTESWSYAMQAASVAYVISGVLKGGHRYKFDFQGSFTDTDNPGIVQDAFWSHNLGTGIKTYIGLTWSISGITAPTSAQVPFRSDHKYSVTLDKNVGSDNAGTITKANNFTTPANSVGTISAVMTDMGEYAL